MTFGQLLDDWMTIAVPARVKSSNTAAQCRWAVEKHLKPSLGSVRLRQLRPEDFENFMRQRAGEGMARASISRLRTHAARALRWAERRDLVSRNAAELAEMPAQVRPKAEGRSLTVKQATKLLEVARTDRLGPLVTVGLMLGLRPGELCGLRWCDIDTAAGVLSVRQTRKREFDEDGREVLTFGDAKTAKSHRTVGMPAPVVEALRRQRFEQAAERLKMGEHWQDHDLVFATGVGTPINPSNLRRAMASLTNKAELGTWTPRDLRHSAASLLSAAGVPQHEVADLLGHVDGRMLDRHYRHRVTAAVDAAVAPMDCMFPTG